VGDFTMNELIIEKKARLERCIKQVKVYYSQASNLSFEEDFLKQDAIAINIQRACELAIDIANIAIKEKKLGLPSSSRDSFVLLFEAGLIDKAFKDKLCKMVGFRNVLVHAYQNLDLKLMKNLIEENLLEDLVIFSAEILRKV
jgi:uncharacterized protein YutE (UPF0331/DUF86 family)